MSSYYVYFLIDPRDDRPFYVGKGSGRRIKQHVWESRNPSIIGNIAKLKRIREIEAAGLRVVEQIESWHESESEAFRVERDFICSLEGLTNLSDGQKQTRRERALAIIANIKPFDVWQIRNPQSVELAQRVFGDPEAFYLKYVAEWQNLAETA